MTAHDMARARERAAGKAKNQHSGGPERGHQKGAARQLHQQTQQPDSQRPAKTCLHDLAHVGPDIGSGKKRGETICHDSFLKNNESSANFPTYGDSRRAYKTVWYHLVFSG